MTIWVDAHLSPAIATWITITFGITALALRDVGLRDAEDPEIFEAARARGVIFITKDSDFADLIRSSWNTATSYLVDMWQYVKCPIERDSEFNIARSIRAFTIW